jgi:hypothetical protein
MSEKLKPGGPDVTGEGYNPDVAPRKEPSFRQNKNSRLGTLSAAALSFLAATTIPTNAPTPEDAGGAPVTEIGAERQETPVDAASETERTEKAQAMLKEAETLLRGQGLAEQVPMFGPHPDSKTACKFLDTWYKPQKPRLNVLWRYAEPRHERWSDELKTAMSTALKMSSSVGTSINWAIWNKDKKLPMTMEELYARLDKKLAIPPDTESTCGMLFDMGYSYLQSGGHDTEIQNVFRQMILGFSVLISRELEARQPGERDEEYAAARELATVVQALVPQTNR